MDSSHTFSRCIRESAERIAESGPAALAGLYDLAARRLVRYAIAITRNQHDAEDAVQAALVRVADSPRLLGRADQPWPYLLRMVRNESLVILRRKRRWTSLVNLADLLTRRGVDEVEREETYRQVWAALRTLPTEQSEVVVLKIWESMTFLQIAEVLDASPSTVASRYRYAMEKLARSLGRSMPSDAPQASPLLSSPLRPGGGR